MKRYTVRMLGQSAWSEADSKPQAIRDWQEAVAVLGGSPVIVDNLTGEIVTNELFEEILESS